MTILDFAVIAIITVFALVSRKRGFIRSLTGVVTAVAGIMLTKVLNPVVFGVLRNTSMSQTLIKNLDAVIPSADIERQREFIDALALPDILKNALAENNNPVVYDLLGVSRFRDYIINYIADVCLSVFSFIVTLLVTVAILRIAAFSLNIISKAPVIGAFDRTLGLIIGVAQGVIAVWVLSVAATFLCGGASGSSDFFAALDKSVIALPLYENNPIMSLVTNIFS